jgi:hypothetical protein
MLWKPTVKKPKVLSLSPSQSSLNGEQPPPHSTAKGSEGGIGFHGEKMINCVSLNKANKKGQVYPKGNNPPLMSRKKRPIPYMPLSKLLPDHNLVQFITGTPTDSQQFSPRGADQ